MRRAVHSSRGHPGPLHLVRGDATVRPLRAAAPAPRTPRVYRVALDLPTAGLRAGDRLVVGSDPDEPVQLVRALTADVLAVALAHTTTPRRES